MPPGRRRSRRVSPRTKAKLAGYSSEPAKTLRDYPPSDTSVPARYARAYAYHKEALVDKALAETEALLDIESRRPLFPRARRPDPARIGASADALEPLRRATKLTDNQPLIAALFGHALIATEDRAHHAEAEQVLKAAVARDRYNPFAWYQLGVVYAASGDMPRARLASAEQQIMSAPLQRGADERTSGRGGPAEGHSRLAARAGHRDGRARELERQRDNK